MCTSDGKSSIKLVFNAGTSGTVYFNLECLDHYQRSCFGGSFLVELVVVVKGTVRM